MSGRAVSVRALPASVKRKLKLQRPRRSGDELAVRFKHACLAAGIPLPVTEYRFHPVRKWRMDFAWPDERLYLEVDGGIWTQGRHTRGSGWSRDTEKINTAASMGWRLMRCTPSTATAPETLALIRVALSAPPTPEDHQP